MADNSSSEPLEVGRNAVVSDFSLFREEPADVLPTDRLVIRGLICEVKGRAFAWQYMSGSAAGQAVKANIVEG